VVNVQNALIVDLKKQLAASNELVQRTEIEVKNHIITDFSPTTSKRSTKPGEATVVNEALAPKKGSYAEQVLNKVLNEKK
jgi:hypothetical protein